MHRERKRKRKRVSRGEGRGGERIEEKKGDIRGRRIRK